jgi:hypothetical protein
VNGETRPWYVLAQETNLESNSVVYNAAVSVLWMQDFQNIACLMRIGFLMRQSWMETYYMFEIVEVMWRIVEKSGSIGITKQLQPRVLFVRTRFCYVVRHAPKRALEMWQGRKSAPERQTFRSRGSFAKLVSAGSNFKPSTEPIV